MNSPLVIIGAGVSGLTCAVSLAEAGWPVKIFAEEIGQATTSAVAAAIWFPYDVEPLQAAISWSLETYEILRGLSSDAASGVSMIELRSFAREGEIAIPLWAIELGAEKIARAELPECFASGYRLEVPLTDTSIYLDYLAARFRNAGGEIETNICFERLEDVSTNFDLIVNCAGIGARTLVPDPELEPHRGQVVLMPKMEMKHAVVCDDPPLMYAIPRANDCLLGGSNEISAERSPDPALSARIVAECSRVLEISPPKILAERAGLRPFRRNGICLRREQLPDGRTVIHNYGHGGAGFTLSWGCAREVVRLITR